MRFFIFLLLVVSSLVANGFPTNQSKQLAQQFINNSKLESSEWKNHPEIEHIRRRRALALLLPFLGKILDNFLPKTDEEPVPTSDSKQPVLTSGSNGVTNNIEGDTNNFG
uniref:Uncharacterized protein n=1 Tax=Caenorhabditis japonica TaxID=281687 RepID=A0A8R1EDW0_CAEJA